jgi:hypothetical protein
MRDALILTEAKRGKSLRGFGQFVEEMVQLYKKDGKQIPRPMSDEERVDD